jgi:hypothetical protein
MAAGVDSGGMAKSTYVGGCQCGMIRYTLTAKTIVAYACHCLECQKQSASAFALSVPALASDLEVVGPAKEYRRPTQSGAHTICWFCRTCGTRVYHQSLRSLEFVTLKAGTLDDTTAVAPVAHLWVKRKQPWVQLSADVPRYATQPADLIAWRNGLVSMSRFS